MAESLWKTVLPLAVTDAKPSSHRLLVVGLAPAVLESLERSLRNHGHRAISCKDAAAARSLAKHFVPSALVVTGDLREAPTMELFATLALSPATRRLPIAVVGPVLETALAIEALRMGAVAIARDGPQMLADLVARLDAVRSMGAEMWIGSAGAPPIRRLAAHLAALHESGDLLVKRGADEATLTFEDGKMVHFVAGTYRGPGGLAAWLANGSAEPATYAFDPLPSVDVELVSEIEVQPIELPTSIVVDDVALDVALGKPIEVDALRSLEEVTSPGKRNAARQLTDDELLSGRAPAPFSLKRSLPPIRALVVEDDPELRQLYTMLLTHAGCTVQSAPNGAEGYLRTVEQRPDVVLSDIMMPHGDGWTFLSHVRDDHRVRETCVVLVSYHPDLLADLSRVDAGADDYLEKNLPLPQLVERVMGALEPRRRKAAQLLVGGAHGFLSEIGPQHLLDAACRSGACGVVRVDDGWSKCRAYFRDGFITHAAARVGDVVLADDAALATIFGLDDAPFLVERGPRPPEETLALPWDALRGRVCDSLNLMQALARDGAREERVLTMQRALFAIYLRHCPDVVRHVARSLGEGLSPSALVRSGAASPALVETVVADLFRKGVASVA